MIIVNSLLMLSSTRGGPLLFPTLVAALNFMAYLETWGYSMRIKEDPAERDVTDKSLFWFSILSGGIGAIIAAIRYKVFLNKPTFWLYSLFGSALGLLITWASFKFLILPHSIFH